jgi:hypothetical protein
MIICKHDYGGYTAFYTMSCESLLRPFLLDDCMDVGARATHGAVGERRIKTHDISTASHQCSTLATLSLKEK